MGTERITVDTEVPLRRRKMTPTAGAAGVRTTTVMVLATASLLVGLLGCGSNQGTTTPPKSAAVLSEQGLRTIAGALHSPVYWEGPQQGVTYELAQMLDGRIFVRYRPPGAKAGKQTYPFVATLPVQNAFATTKAQANRPGSIKVLDGYAAVSFYSPSSPTQLYLAFRGSSYQIEVSDPDRARSRELVAQGKIVPVGASAAVPPKPVTVSLARLKALPAKLHHPVYWTGPQAGVKYELTQTPAGGVFVRYLPAGVQPGATREYPFVGTLPLKNAFSATNTVAHRPGAVRIPLRGGAVAFYARARPTNLYLAFPGSPYQVEVFAPDPKQGRGLVSTGRIRPTP